jgi:hypothetical protein
VCVLSEMRPRQKVPMHSHSSNEIFFARLCIFYLGPEKLRAPTLCVTQRERFAFFLFDRLGSIFLCRCAAAERLIGLLLRFYLCARGKETAAFKSFRLIKSEKSFVSLCVRGTRCALRESADLNLFELGPVCKLI